MIAALDVGASKVRAGIFDCQAHGEAVFYNRYSVPDWTGLIPLLHRLIDDAGQPRIEHVAIGLAGPVFGRRAQMTNLGWSFDCDQIEAEFLGSRVHLLNDLVAHGYGTVEVPIEQMTCIKEGVAVDGGNRALIAAGSGLGECILFWDGQRYVPKPSEGGHTDFAPSTDLHIELLHDIKTRHHGHVSWERVISGKYGFAHLYRFLVGRGSERLYDIDVALEVGQPVGPLIYQHAKQQAPTALELVSLFYDLYAAEAGNLALKALATSGVFISGGIARKLERWLDVSRFAEVFVSKGRMRHLLERVPVYLVTDPNAAVHGLAAFARQVASFS